MDQVLGRMIASLSRCVGPLLPGIVDMAWEAAKLLRERGDSRPVFVVYLVIGIAMPVLPSRCGRPSSQRAARSSASARKVG